MNELTIEPSRLRSLILRVREIMGREGTIIPDSGDNPSDNAEDSSAGAVMTDALQDSPDDLTRDQVMVELESLNEDQRTELVALMWVGRGDAEAEDWDEMLQLAAERQEGPAADYLLRHPLVADYWAEGLDKLGHGSRVLDAGEY